MERIVTTCKVGSVDVKVTIDWAEEFSVSQSGADRDGKPWGPVELSQRSLNAITANLSSNGYSTPVARVTIQDDPCGLNHAGVADLIREALINA